MLLCSMMKEKDEVDRSFQKDYDLVAVLVLLAVSPFLRIA